MSDLSERKQLQEKGVIKEMKIKQELAMAMLFFMGVVCETVSIAELPTIEAIFISKVKEKLESRN